MESDNVRDRQWLLVGALAGLALTLFLIGVVSGTLIRHSIQAAPSIFVLLGAALKRAWARPAAAAIFAFWLFIMILIWLFLLKIAHIVTGNFTRTEILLTLAAGLSCCLGLASILFT